MLVLMASLAGAFPLSGGNGQFNATVFGTYTEANIIVVDMMYDFRGYKIEGVQDHDFLKVHLVDSDDKFYESSDKVGIGYGSRYSQLKDLLEDRKRALFFFKVPSDKPIEIKRLRITPAESRGSPFSIEWMGVPEVIGMPISMKFYSIERKSGDYYSQMIWSADIKITNNDPVNQVISGLDFVLIDQFGYPHASASDGEVVTLLPGESMRFNVRFPDVSKLSRPIYMQYAPSNLTMDISAWA
jgi:hypothetical protein